MQDIRKLPLEFSLQREQVSDQNVMFVFQITSGWKHTILQPL